MHPSYKAQPTVMILFGLTGDLATKKIIPSLFHLHSKNLLPNMFSVVGFSRREFSKDSLNEHLIQVLGKHEHINPTKQELESFLQFFSYQQGLFDEASGYEKLSETLGKKDGNWNVCSNKLFYLSVPPKYYEKIFKYLSESGLTKPCSEEEGWTRVIVEKPFGHDLETAQNLDKQLGQLFKEEQIYRIDHYLGKEILQNVLAFRFANNLLENDWNKDGIEQINIRFLENIGVENRGNFYDRVGALRDVGQNHILQMLALSTMENPKALDGENVRKKRSEILETLKPLSHREIEENTIRAQYKGYTQIEGVIPTSSTETYFKIECQLSHPKWQGVPITLEGGKKLEESKKEIEIVFNVPNNCICEPTKNEDYKNRLYIRLDTPQSIQIKFWAKKPGLSMDLEERFFEFDFYENSKENYRIEEYEKLLIDCILGNQTLFVSTKEVEAMWKFVDPIICAWDENKIPLKKYDQGQIL